MGIITFNGVSSDSLGVVVEHAPDYQIAEPNIENITIPGRNGNILIHDGSYKNVNRSYEIAFVDSDTSTYRDRARAVAEWLFSPTQYSRLEDTYESDYYREAMCISSVSITNILERAGRCTVDFNCKPQRYFKSGENAITINEAAFPYSIPAQSNFIAIPDLIFTFTSYSGTASITMTAGRNSICSFTVSCPGGGGYVTSLIGDLKEYIYGRPDSGAGAINTFFTLSGSFPYLAAGASTRFVLDSATAFDKLEVIPKWWTL